VTGNFLNDESGAPALVSGHPPSGEALAASFAAAPVGVVVVDRRGAIRTSNPALQSMFGYAEHALVGISIEMLVPEALRARHRAHRADYDVRPEVRGMGTALALRALHCDGHTFPIDVALSPVLLSDGTGVIAIVVDCSVRDALRRSEELHSSVIRTMAEGLYVEDLEGHLIESNPAARRISRTSSGDLRTLALVREDGTTLPTCELPDAVARATGEACNDVVVGLPDTEHGLRWLSVSARPLRDEDDQPWATVCTFNDITEKRRVERLKNEFVSVVSHEMRTPLTSIKGALGLVDGGAFGTLADGARQMITIAATNADRLIRLVNDILDLERIESGRIEPVRLEADLVLLINDAVTIMRPLAQRDRIEIIGVSAQAGGIRVVVDRDRIVQLITNLLSNAVKFSTAGSSVTITIEPSPTPEPADTVSVRVVDRGRGVPPQLLEDIFERFHQVDASDSRDKGGTGLGLTICRNIVEEHGGQIWAEQTPGVGATFVWHCCVA
jgi:PAS domain S-box-containing protein